jgi:hypothetical protein
MKSLKLTNSNKECLVDDEDFEFVSLFNWCLQRSGYVLTTSNPRHLLHRVILGSKIDITGCDVDHKDRNPLNNQKSNLRVATKSQNGANRTKQKNNTSGFKGIYLTPSLKWQVKVGNHFVGNFTAILDAAIAYDLIAKRRFGDFALLNYPEAPLEYVVRVINSMIEPKKRQGTSCYKGVTKSGSRWRAKVTSNGKYIHLGYFNDEVQAARAYDKFVVINELNLRTNFHD